MKKEQIDNLIEALVREGLVDQFPDGYKLSEKGRPIFINILSDKLSDEMLRLGIEEAKSIKWETVIDETIKIMEESEYKPLMFFIDHYAEVMEMKAK